MTPMEIDPQQQLRQYQILCKKALDRTRSKLVKQEIEFTEANKCQWYAHIADSLLAHPDTCPKGSIECAIENIHSRQVETITVNPKLNVFQNAQLYYKKAKKGTRSLDIVAKKVSESKEEIHRFENLHQTIELLGISPQAPDAFEKGLENIFNNLDALGLVPKPPKPLPNGQKPETIPYRHYTLEGWDIYLGKTDVQNDELTTRFAKPSDIWMHVASHAGSHVVIRRNKNTEWPPKNILLVAASFAVWFSKAKHTTSCEVHYTEARYVHKRRKSPAGQVVMQQFKSVRVAPKSPGEYFPGEYD